MLPWSQRKKEFLSMLLQKHSIVGQYSLNSNDPASFRVFAQIYDVTANSKIII